MLHPQQVIKVAQIYRKTNMATSGNLPPSTNSNPTTAYFNNFFSETFSVSPDTNDAIVAYFQSITGDIDAGKNLASTVIYTALSQGLEPMSLVDEFKRLRSGKVTENKTPLDSATVISTYTAYDSIVEHKNEYPVGQLFYSSTNNTFYRSYSVALPDEPLQIQTTFNNPTFLLDNEFALPQGQEIVNHEEIVNPDTYIQKTYIDQTVQIQTVGGYKAEPVLQTNGQTGYNYFYVTYSKDKDELTAYLTVLLNQNRVGTSLLGISNNPQINKYIQRSILA